MAESSSKIDRATVEYVARLSRIDLTGDELDLLAGQLTRIVDYIDQLNELDTDDVEPLAQAVEIPNVLREDTPRSSLAVSEALSNAPEKTGHFYRVPAVLE